MFCGDPSTGKSQLLHAAVQVAARGVSTVGLGSSGVGLTAALTRDMGEWALEPGALALAHGGVCAIDEFRTIPAAERTALHEAMEQQSISIAKAGVVATLRTEASVIAACNPNTATGSGRGGGAGGVATSSLNPLRRRQVEIGVGPALLSRFDLIFFVQDTADRDAMVAAHVLALSGAASDGGRDGGPSPATTALAAPFSVAQLRAYCALCRSRARSTGVWRRWLNAYSSCVCSAAAAATSANIPLTSAVSGFRLGARASELLGIYFHALRENDGHGAARADIADGLPVTVRVLEALVRLTQAHAALLSRAGGVCVEEDAAMAILLMEHTVYRLGLPVFYSEQRPRNDRPSTDAAAAVGNCLEHDVQFAGAGSRGGISHWFLRADDAAVVAQRAVLQRLAVVVRTLARVTGAASSGPHQSHSSGLSPDAGVRSGDASSSGSDMEAAPGMGEHGVTRQTVRAARRAATARSIRSAILSERCVSLASERTVVEFVQPSIGRGKHAGATGASRSISDAHAASIVTVLSQRAPTSAAASVEADRGFWFSQSGVWGTGSAAAGLEAGVAAAGDPPMWS
jgi:hypothetical protein